MKQTATVILIVLCAATVFANAAVKVQRRPCSWPGGDFTIDINWQNIPAGFQMGGFDFALKYDSGLICIGVDTGQLLIDCGWEYFSHDLSTPYLVRLVALADLVNGSIHPSCFGETPGVLATLTFRVDNDQSLIGDFLSVWWYWYDCGDNGISSKSGDTLFISDRVYHFDGTLEYEITRDAPFPTPYGAPDTCTSGGSGPVRAIDFYNGGLLVSGPDVTPPTVHCPDPIIVPNEPGQCGAPVTYQAAATDNCSEVTVDCWPRSGTFFTVGTSIVTCQAIDIGGNTDICQFYVTVTDTSRPAVACPNDTAVVNDSGQCGASVGYSASAADNCPDVDLSLSPPSGSSFMVGTSQVRTVATDATGNADTCLFNVTVYDAEPPVVWCPDDITVAADSASCGAVVTYGAWASDNCQWVQIVTNPLSGTLFPVGSTLVEVIGADLAGNMDTCYFTVTVKDTIAPSIVCPDDMVVNNDSGLCGATVAFAATATDNCAGVIVTADPPSGAFFDIGVTTVTVTASDSSGNTDTCVFTVAIDDTEPPIANCPTQITVGNDSGQCGAVVQYQVTATDNCPGVDVATSPPTGSFFPVGTTFVDVTAVDSSGNTDSCSFPVIVVDTGRPVVSCPEDIEAPNDSGEYGAVVQYTVSAVDNCIIESIETDPPSGWLFPVGATPVQVVAGDSAGNADTCSFNVTVFLNDPDGDSLPNWDDNCPQVYNPDQSDTDSNGVGDACCCEQRGNVDNIVGIGGPIDVADLTYLVAHLFSGGSPPPCPEQGNADSVIGNGGPIDVADLTFLVSYLFQGGQAPSSC
ncbi:MAG: HYR domain-containing protein [Candidatus Zixiibacteriota bacterium]